MSELINKNDNRATIRWKLLTGVSALALTAYVSSGPDAMADDNSGPQIWIELGGQLSRLDDGQKTFVQDFPNSPPRPAIFSSSQSFEYPPRFSIDEDGTISFQPKNSDWVFSASIRYGRSSTHKNVHQQTKPGNIYKYRYYYGRLHKLTGFPAVARFADTNAQTSEKHVILDFQAGKDLGLGMFGSTQGSSTLNFGVRFAQFRSKSDIALKSDPDWHRVYKYVPQAVYYGFTSTKFVTRSLYHTNAASLKAARDFHGVGPSISWNGSAPLAGNAESSELLLDWGVNAAILFGRQRAVVQHQAHGSYHANKYPGRVPTFNPLPVNVSRSKAVTVPNVGGFAGLSFKYDNAKVSFGYKADFFFNAMDGGIDARKSENRDFYGPFASVSFGLGD
ncbi:MAG TPA: hypothetical protein VGT78_12805 [Rhizomicrobium sp.]|nr:hypothetical protein [Rhizomicrobium sp.]